MEERRNGGDEEEQLHYNEEIQSPSALTALTNALLAFAQTMNQNYGPRTGKRRVMSSFTIILVCTRCFRHFVGIF